MPDLEAGPETEPSERSCGEPAMPIPERGGDITPIERSTWESYIFGGASMIASFSTSLWIKLLFVVILTAVSIDIIWRSPLTRQLSKYLRVLLLALAVSGIGYFGWSSFAADQMPLTVRFMEPQFMSGFTKLRVRWRMNAYNKKLIKLGVKVPSELPAVGGAVRSGPIIQDTLMIISRDHPWEVILSVDARASVRPESIGTAYLIEALDRYVGPDYYRRATAIAEDFASYFGCSFGNDDRGCGSGLPRALWHMRAKYGVPVIDQLVADSAQELLQEKQVTPPDSGFVVRGIVDRACRAGHTDDETCLGVQDLLTTYGVPKP